MRHVIVSTIVTSVTLLAGCGRSLEPRVPAGAVSLEVETLTEPIANFQYSYRMADRERLVIRDADRWADVWSSMTASMMPPPPVPAVDFSRHMVILAAMGTRPTGGYSIAVESAWEGNGTVFAAVQETSPGSSCGVTAAVTAPVIAVRVPGRDLSVVFVESSHTTTC